MPAKLSPALRRLLQERIDSFEKLEIVFALHQTPGQRARRAELVERLQLDRYDLDAALDQLAHARLVAVLPPDTIAFAAQPTAVADTLRELLQLYVDDKSALAVAIAEIAMDRLRNLAGKAFADAFLIRKKRGPSDDC